MWNGWNVEFAKVYSKLQKESVIQCCAC